MTLKWMLIVLRQPVGRVRSAARRIRSRRCRKARCRTSAGRPRSEDELPPFNFDDYFVGKWTFEWDVPEGPLGESGRITGTTVYSAIEAGKFYQADTDAERPRRRLQDPRAHRLSERREGAVAARHRQPRLLASPARRRSAATSAASTTSSSTARRSRSTARRSASSTRCALLSPFNYKVATTVSVDGGAVQELRQPLVAKGRGGSHGESPNRWLPVVGGVMMNMALGMFYGMSVFMLPLEKEFGWTRAQTSWATTIGLAMIAAVVRRRRLHPGSPRPAARGDDRRNALQRSGSSWPASRTSLPWFYLTAGVDCRHRQRLRLRRADLGRIEMVSPTSAAWSSA